MNGRHWFEVQANNLFIFTEIFLLLSWDAWKNRILTRTRINSSLSVRCSLSLFRWNSSDSNFCLFGGRTPRGGAVPRRQLLNRLAGGDVSLLFIHSLGSFLWMTFVNESYVTPSSDWHSIPSNSNDLKLIKLRRCFYLQWRNIAHKSRKECSWSNKLFNRITIACCPPPPFGGGAGGRDCHLCGSHGNEVLRSKSKCRTIVQRRPLRLHLPSSGPLCLFWSQNVCWPPCVFHW